MGSNYLNNLAEKENFMTHITFPYAFSPKTIIPTTIGFDKMFSTLEEFDKLFEHTKPPTYPPYNIVKSNENLYEIQIAVSGFKRDDLDIIMEHQELIIRGDIKQKEENVSYLHKGLAFRKFEHKFKLSENVIVNTAFVEDGILYIKLEHVIPEDKKPKKIQIL